MIALFTPNPPLMGTIIRLPWVTVIVMMAGCALLMLYPSQRNRVAWGWIAVGLFQVVLSGFWAYPYQLFVTFPIEAAYGLLTLTSGVVLATFGVLKMQNPRRILGIGMILLGCMELVPFLDFYFRFPGEWNIVLEYTPSVAFLLSAIVTLSCGVLVLLKSAK